MTPTAAPASPPLITAQPTRSAAAASRTALKALILRALGVLRKHFWEFLVRTLIQPFLLVFVFLYVFPKIGQGIGPAHASSGPAAARAGTAFPPVRVPGGVAFA